MPRDKGGNGRTGSKHKKAIAKFHAKKKEAAARPATRSSSPASTAAPATTRRSQGLSSNVKREILG
eukprot:1757703-Prymnesium_polylepis.1